jgi:hypothetical protein
LTVFPWTLRNYVVTGTPALVCFGGGLNFYFGHNDVSVGYRDLAQTPMSQLTTQAAIDAAGYKLGFEYFGRNPFGFFTRGAKKVQLLFGSPGYAPHGNSAIMLPDGWQTDPEKGRIAEALRARQRAKNAYLDGVFTVLARMHSWLLILGALAACVAWRRLPAELRTGVWLCVYWIVSHVIFWAQPRFRYPMEIPMALLTAFALVGAVAASRPGFVARSARSASPRAARREPGPARRRARAAFFGVAVVALLAALGCTPPQSTQLPGIEPWGDLASPYDDPIEVAAANALGPRPEGGEYRYQGGGFDPLRLADFLMLDGSERQARSGMAYVMVGQAQGWKRVSGVDSLAAYTEAIRIDPSCAAAYAEAARITRARGEIARAKALALQGLRLDSQRMSLWGTLSNIYLDTGDDARARQALEHALQLKGPPAPGMWEALAVLYLRTGRRRVPLTPQHAPQDVAADPRPTWQASGRAIAAT